MISREFIYEFSNFDDISTRENDKKTGAEAFSAREMGVSCSEVEVECGEMGSGYGEVRVRYGEIRSEGGEVEVERSEGDKKADLRAKCGLFREI